MIQTGYVPGPSYVTVLDVIIAILNIATSELTVILWSVSRSRWQLGCNLT